MHQEHDDGKHDRVDQKLKHCLHLLREMAGDKVERREIIVAERRRTADKADVDYQIPDKVVRPKKGLAEEIAAYDLDERDKNHYGKYSGNAVHNGFIGHVRNLF